MKTNATETKEAAPTVRVCIPLLPDTGSGLQPDQTEQVIINGRVTVLCRGEYLDVSPEVYLLLRRRYPNL